jgi:DnaJ domain
MSGNNIKDYYYILGLTADVSKDEIKKAYRKLSVKFHPDKNDGDKFFEERFKDINEAYETLVDDIKRKIYDDRLKSRSAANQSQSSRAAESPEPSTSPYPNRKKAKEKLYTILAALVFLIPAAIKIAVNKINEKEKLESYHLLPKDTIININNTLGDSVTLLKIYKDSTINNTLDDSVVLQKVYEDSTILPRLASPAPGIDSVNSSTTVNPVNDPLLRFKDDDGLTAADAVSYFFNALNNNDCNSAWNMSYNIYWVRAGQDWFCSSKAFGGVRKLQVRNIYTVAQNDTGAEIYADYYAEDIYNGNKCFKQNIIVQKIEYTDYKFRWRITKMTNNEEPVVCNESQLCCSFGQGSLSPTRSNGEKVISAIFF